MVDKLVFPPPRKPHAKPSQKSFEYENFWDFVASVRDLSEVLLPIVIRYRGVEIWILEANVVDYGDHKVYIVSLQFKYRGYVTKPFPIAAYDMDDFIRKLRFELMKFKLLLRVNPDAINLLKTPEKG